MPDRDRVFKEAQSVIRTFLREINAQAPGLVTDVYITGSIALGEARPGQSDVDIVLVRPDDVDDAIVIRAFEPILASLRETHPRPPLDGIVLSRSDPPMPWTRSRGIGRSSSRTGGNYQSAEARATRSHGRPSAIAASRGEASRLSRSTSGKMPNGSPHGRTKTWRSTGDPSLRGAKDCSPVAGCGPSGRISLSGACWE